MSDSTTNGFSANPLPLARCLIATAILAGAAGCNSSEITARQVQVLGSEQVIDRIRGAKIGQVYRVAWSKDRIPAGHEVIGEFEGYPVLAGPVSINEETTSNVAAIVVQESREGSDVRPECEFVPGIGVQLGDDDGKAVNILFCFDCNEFMVIENGKRFEIEGIGNSRDALLDLFKPLFPQDKNFQRVKTIAEMNGGRRPT